MDLSRAVYSRDLKIAAMRALDAGSTTGEIARKYQISPQSAGALARRVARQRGSGVSRALAARRGSARSWTTPAGSPSWNVRSASSRWRMIF